MRRKRRIYWWLYIADAVRTCVYEAGFIKHDKTSQGQSYIDPNAAQIGQIASLVFPKDLRLLNLTGGTLFNMDIYDLISDPDHEWCKWFAYQLVDAGFFTGKDAFDGILYPSRKNRGKDAIALYSGYVNQKRIHKKVKFAAEPFDKTIDYRAFVLDKNIIPAP